MDRPVAVVTGASSGFGHQTVRELADLGWMTIGIARRGDRLESLADEVGGRHVVCDLTDPDQIKATASGILDEFPAVKLLVNNAGKALRGRFDEVDIDEAYEAMQTNYFGTLLMTQALRPGLERAASSDVVNVISAAGTIIKASSGAYGASKYAQLALSRCQTVDLEPSGIAVHAILPGEADTEGHPQRPSHSALSKLTSKLIGTDVDTVAAAVIDRIGKKSGEVYVPKRLRAVAMLNAVLPVPTGRAVNKLTSKKVS
jgi:short-subunit dehydrogenase